MPHPLQQKFDGKKRHGESPVALLSGAESQLELKMVQAWQQQAWWLWLLWPLSALYGLVTGFRRQLYSKGILRVYRAPVPVMVVGNITVGGSGKTPLIIQLVRYLQTQYCNVGVISRGYGGDESAMPCLVTVDSQPSTVGDEPCLIVRETGVAMSVCPNRQLAIECLLDHDADISLIIADDGLQHYQLHRDIEWIVVDSARGFGNKQLLPTGFLREPLSRLHAATVVYHQPPASLNQMDSVQRTMHLAPDSLIPLELESQAYEDKDTALLSMPTTVYAVSGIGYPQRFFATLRQLGFAVIEHPMPDHHEFVPEDLTPLSEHPIIITTKDAVKIAPLVKHSAQLASLRIWVLPVQAVLSQACYDTLDQQLAILGIN